VTGGFLELLAQLHDAGARFVVVGGVASALHGGTRVTFDLDIVPSLDEVHWRHTVEFLWSVGARPRIPESLDRICDVALVREWRREKGMLALNFRTPDGSTEVDLMVSESDRFDELQSRAVVVQLEGRTFSIVSLEDLIAMKEAAGRPQDLLDVAELRRLKDEQK
jgi:predicted nucleotidyltransferase